MIYKYITLLGKLHCFYELDDDIFILLVSFLGYSASFQNGYISL